MTAADLVVTRLKTEEGFRATAYTDTTGHLTWGYGCNISAGITPYAATALLQAQVTEVALSLAANWWWGGLDDVRASVVIDVAFNVGVHGLLQFVNMLSAIGKKDWSTASAELLDSTAAKQLPARYQALAQTLLTGVA